MARPGNGGRSFSADFKARVARDAMRETDALKAVAARHGVHPSQVKVMAKPVRGGRTGGVPRRRKEGGGPSRRHQGPSRQDRRAHDGKGFFQKL